VSLLFNWPSTGGGTVHTFETARFLKRAGYEVKHLYVKSSVWEVGRVEEPLDYPAEPISWQPSPDGVADLQRQIRKAVDAFAPDFVILTDSWTMKPRLAQAVQGYKFFLRLAAQECLCPLNNVRMLVDKSGQVTRCPRHQLATPESCRECVATKPQLSGVLHQRERDLAGYGTEEYDQSLNWAFAEAEAVLVVNPLIETMVSPYSRRVHVVPSGFDPTRFPWPWPVQKNPRTVILFAGLIQELMKGFAVVHAACQRLWSERQDFELWITDDPVGQRDAFTRAIGWKSQADLPKTLRQSDIVVFPTVAEEALGRTAVEAMAVGRPVVASRIGGLSWTVQDGATGLLFEAGDSVDLAEKLSRLLDDSELREQLGTNGRKRFEAEYTWDVILARHYRPLLERVDEPSSGRCLR
jgi:glycosyltransferase involved in cell wall biosynthesis